MSREQLSLEELDRSCSDGPVVVRWNGEPLSLPDPATLSTAELIPLLDERVAIIKWGLGSAPRWKAFAAHQYWCDHYDLPSVSDARRAVALVSRYREEIERDFQGVYQLDWRLLWKSREFRRLLNLIDGLPVTSHYAGAMANDEEYIRAVIQANGGQMPQSKTSPSLTVWTQEASTLATIADVLKSTQALLIKINSKQGSSAPKVDPEPRPVTAWSGISLEVRLGKHRALASRLLGDRANN